MAPESQSRVFHVKRRFVSTPIPSTQRWAHDLAQALRIWGPPCGTFNIAFPHPALFPPHGVDVGSGLGASRLATHYVSSTAGLHEFVSPWVGAQAASPAAHTCGSSVPFLRSRRARRVFALRYQRDVVYSTRLCAPPGPMLMQLRFVSFIRGDSGG